MNYKLIHDPLNGNVSSICSDIGTIPVDASNRDYRTYLAWLAEGNTPDPADPEPEPSFAPTLEERLTKTEAELAAIRKSVPAEVAQKIDAELKK